MCFDTETFNQKFDIQLIQDNLKLKNECIKVYNKKEDFDDYTNNAIMDLIETNLKKKQIQIKDLEI